MIRVVGIALLLASILLDASQGNTFTHYAFSPKIGVWQADENHHTVVDLATSAVDTECADYCTHRGSLFRDMECGAFFVKNNTECHMVPKALAGVTTSEDGIIYYTKS